MDFYRMPAKAPPYVLIEEQEKDAKDAQGIFALPFRDIDMRKFKKLTVESSFELLNMRSGRVKTTLRIGPLNLAVFGASASRRSTADLNAIYTVNATIHRNHGKLIGFAQSDGLASGARSFTWGNQAVNSLAYEPGIAEVSINTDGITAAPMSMAQLKQAVQIYGAP